MITLLTPRPPFETLEGFLGSLPALPSAGVVDSAILPAQKKSVGQPEAAFPHHEADAHAARAMKSCAVARYLGSWADRPGGQKAL